MSFRREFFNKFDERLKGYWGFEDEACLQITKRGYKILCDPQIMVYHYVAPITAEYSRGEDKQALVSAHHNNVYISLKHFSNLRKIFFLIYTFIFGDTHYLGLIRYLMQFYKQPRTRGSIGKRVVWMLSGNMLGIKSYFKYLSKLEN